jgi:hypothetical protein
LLEPSEVRGSDLRPQAVRHGTARTIPSWSIPHQLIGDDQLFLTFGGSIKSQVDLARNDRPVVQFEDDARLVGPAILGRI